MSELSGWTRGSHSAGEVTHPTYRRGVGPGVVLIHEIPGTVICPLPRAS